MKEAFALSKEVENKHMAKMTSILCDPYENSCHSVQDIKKILAGASPDVGNLSKHIIELNILVQRHKSAQKSDEKHGP